jgi:hypothetical protein
VSGNFAVDGNTLYVDASNNRVGIGKSDPSVALDISGSTNIFGNLTISSAFFLTGIPRMAIIQHTENAGQHGGTAPNNNNTRKLNFVVHDTIGVTLSSNVFTLPSGTYYITARAPGFRIEDFRIKLVNNSTGSILIYGTNATSKVINSAGYAVVHSTLSGVISLGSSTQLRIDCYSNATYNVNTAFGGAVNEGTNNEVYTQVDIIKLA